AAARATFAEPREWYADPHSNEQGKLALALRGVAHGSFIYCWPPAASSPRGIHARRAAGGDCHHRRSGGATLAGCSGGPRIGAADAVPEQYEADGASGAKLSGGV